MFSNSEYYDMMLCVGLEDGNLNHARELFWQRLIDAKLASYQGFLNMLRRLHSTGSFHRSTGSVPPSTVPDPKRLNQCCSILNKSRPRVRGEPQQDSA
jgi:hypothetical protein